MGWQPAGPPAGGRDDDEYLAEVTGLLAALAPAACGTEVTVFDPDLDPDGQYAARLTEVLVAGLGQLGTQARRTPA